MVHFCADDYGMTENGNRRMVHCLENGVLNKVSVLPNGKISDFKNRLKERGATVSLHINLVEESPLSNAGDIRMLITDQGYFRYSFTGLFFLSLLKGKKLENQIYKELQSQIKFWKEAVGENAEISIDSHQHTHMIPLVFKTLMHVIKDEKVQVDCIRIPSEPVLPYLCTPSLYFSYSPAGLVKQWLLKFLALVNKKELKKSKIQSSYFMGVMFSGRMSEKVIKKLLPKYMRIAEKNGKNIELGFHPGHVKSEVELIEGYRKSFKKFYFSPGRNMEYNTLLNLKFD